MIIELQSYDVGFVWDEDSMENTVYKGPKVQVNTDCIETVTKVTRTHHEIKEYSQIETHLVFFKKKIIHTKIVPIKQYTLYLTKTTSGRKYYFTENVFHLDPK